MSPELTLAKMLKEWHGLDSFYESVALNGDRGLTPAEVANNSRKALNHRLGFQRVPGNPPEQARDHSARAGAIDLPMRRIPNHS